MKRLMTDSASSGIVASISYKNAVTSESLGNMVTHKIDSEEEIDFEGL